MISQVNISMTVPLHCPCLLAVLNKSYKKRSNERYHSDEELKNATGVRQLDGSFSNKANFHARLEIRKL